MVNEASREKNDFRAFAKLGAGIGLRPPHYTAVLENRSQSQWFEVVSENFMIDGGRPLRVLENIRRDYPIATHGVSLSIGSTDPLNEKYLNQLGRLVDRFEPAIVSDHLCWTAVEGENLHDLLPLPYTRETIAHVVPRILEVQERLGRRILLENVSSYLNFAHSEMTEWEFLSEIATTADCGILLDINNIYVNAINHGFNAFEFLAGLPAHRIGQFHLAGHSSYQTEDGQNYLVDTHDHPICKEVWDLYDRAIDLLGPVPTLIERDAKIPSIGELETEMRTARVYLEKVRRPRALSVGSTRSSDAS